ncbi:MAG: EthD domain-containing protein [Sphingomonadaceae bacterium]|nr:EthD domain-containing protein [Sphingomonadaceae bacterium]
MEKIIYALWRPPGLEQEAFNAALLEQLPPALTAAGAERVRINLRDAAVAPAAGLVQRWQDPQQDAVVQLWFPSANAMFRQPIDAAIAAACGHFAAWLVVESTIIANQQHTAKAGERTWGWSQASFISFRPDMARADAIAHWHSHHTRVAIETQTNFEYIQNLIVMPLTDGAPDYDAFVEECFPAEAMTDPAVFFDAVGDAAKFDANLAAMTHSCAGFIDFARIDIIPTSQYDLGAER